MKNKIVKDQKKKQKLCLVCEEFNRILETCKRTPKNAEEFDCIFRERE